MAEKRNRKSMAEIRAAERRAGRVEIMNLVARVLSKVQERGRPLTFNLGALPMERDLEYTLEALLGRLATAEALVQQQAQELSTHQIAEGRRREMIQQLTQTLGVLFATSLNPLTETTFGEAVLMTAVGANKVAAIKAIREIMGPELGLKEAKDLVDGVAAGTPAKILRSQCDSFKLKLNGGDWIKNCLMKLAEAGATAKVV